MKRLLFFRFVYLAILCVSLVWFSIIWKQGQWLETDLRSLLPVQQRWSDVQVLSDKKLEQQLNGQLISLVGHMDSQQAFQLAQQVQQTWQKSGLFSHIFFQTQPNLEQLQHEIQQLKWAVLPTDIRSQLLHAPALYFQQYAQQLVNPFNRENLLPLEQDWLGLGRFVLSQSQQLSQLQWNMQTGTVFIEKDGKTWILLRAELKNTHLLSGEQALLDLVTENRQQIQSQDGELFVAGTALFSAQAKQQAEQESMVMSILGISLTLLLLLYVFRSWRVLWLFLPVILGMILGVIATVSIFGYIHVLTLVVGTSLIGVLIDFPLHWVASALGKVDWNPQRTMRSHLPTFLVSLLVTLFGYGLLWFTDLPILKQTALFSAVALVSAIASTVLFLPILFKYVDFSQRKHRIFSFTGFKLFEDWRIKVLILGFALVGVFRSQWQDDIRQWVSLSPSTLQEAQKVGELTGIDLGSRYFLVVAENDEALLAKIENLSQKLTALSQPHQALSQWILTESRQKNTAAQLVSLVQPQDYQALMDIGIPNNAIQQALDSLVMQSPVSLRQALSTELGQGWKSLYLGELATKQVAAQVKIDGHILTEEVPLLANGQDIFWQDKRASLNQAFQETRNQAAWLKVLSFVLAGLLLWRLFGLAKTLSILMIPFSAVVLTIAILGWLGMPITLFSMFGLLLVSAIGVDYSAYRVSINESIFTKNAAIILSALTTMISFGLLALSSTPAVASFGMSVTIGVLFSLLLNLRKA
ncbi:MMPL family transporter [Conservatibacter flavescens]|uniref:SSD domain-containing protein n=1 Tax=Conservatibacter flavescens TaxID=28161 RepID=A0A2M8S2L4_9PAST|nr:MMPL family transporter [Conservatibacter flavescens]PJG85400.1 hypothetical protein CVP05_06655 [Conservatibacter flavescens]